MLVYQRVPTMQKHLKPLVSTFCIALISRDILKIQDLFSNYFREVCAHTLSCSKCKSGVTFLWHVRLWAHHVARWVIADKFCCINTWPGTDMSKNKSISFLSRSARTPSFCSGLHLSLLGMEHRGTMAWWTCPPCYMQPNGAMPLGHEKLAIKTQEAQNMWRC